MEPRHNLRFFIVSLVSILLLVACDEKQSPSGQTTDLSKEQRLWHLLVADEGTDSRVRRWMSRSINTIWIVDQEHLVQFPPQILDLINNFNDRSPIRVELCIRALGSSLAFDGKPCASGPFDSYFVVTNGQWSDAQWNSAVMDLPAWASGRFRELMEPIHDNAASGKGSCELVLRPSTETAYDIAGTIAVADFPDKKLVGACFITLFLGSLGVSPFDGRGQVDVRAEAESYADFLLKETPNGGLYLTKTLYSTELHPGMTESDATPILRSLLSEDH